MPRGYRCVILAAFGWLILTGQAPKPDAGSKQAQTDTRVGDALTNISATYRDQAERAKRPPESPPCGPAQYDSKDDLCAQWKAADAAADSAWWAWVSAILSGVSLGAVAVALALTIQSNRIARDTAKRQLRAYVSIHSATVTVAEAGKPLTVTAHVKNTGTTPAYEVSNELWIQFKPPLNPGEALPKQRMPVPFMSKHVLSPGEETDIKYTAEHWIMSASDLAEIRSGDLYFWIEIETRYKDAFDQPRETMLRGLQIGKDFGVGPCIMHSEGNSAT